MPDRIVELEQELFHACLELTPPDQDAYLEQACREDAPLRRRIERLLAAHRNASESEDVMEDRIGPYRLIRVLGEGDGNAAWHLEVRRDLARVLLGELDAPLDLPHRRQILVYLEPIGRAERRDERVGAIGHEIENAAALTTTARARLWIEPGVEAAEQPFERQARVRFWRHGRGGTAPRNAVRVRAAISRVAVADRARLVASQLDRWEPRLRADMRRGDLVHRHAVLDVGTRGLLRMNAGEPCGAFAGMIAGTSFLNSGRMAS